jgi:hypothetical protein
MRMGVAEAIGKLLVPVEGGDESHPVILLSRRRYRQRARLGLPSELRMRSDCPRCRHLLRMTSALLGAGLVACATTRTPPPRVDLDPARKAVEAARSAGAEEKAEPVFTRAVGHLTEAESLSSSAAGKDSPERSRQAEGLARLALTEAQCAESLARAGGTPRPESGAIPAGEAERLRGKLRQAEEEQRRLEDRIALLQRDLDVTETEVIRTKAKLKGIETKAEASSAIAEARILMRRVAEENKHSPNLARCQELLDRAEQQLKEENFGAAAFFASKVQELLDATRRGAASHDTDRPAPKARYVAKPGGANLRRGPSTDESLVGKIPAGATVEASAMRGDWLKVKYQDLVGWAFRPLFE